jgi:hypothetical protein
MTKKTIPNVGITDYCGELVPCPFSFEWLIHHKPGEVCSGLCLH